MTTLDLLGFEATYMAEEKPDSRPTVTVRRPRKQRPRDGLNLETPSAAMMKVEVITRTGDIWVGEFEAGPGGVSGLFATPSPDDLCVVNAGYAYLVPTLTPSAYQGIPAIPVKQVVRVPERDILLFVDYSRLVAVGVQGVLWQSQDLSWDGITLVDVSSGAIRGLGWDSPTDRYIDFCVDVETGKATGGSSPHHYT